MGEALRLHPEMSGRLPRTLGQERPRSSSVGNVRDQGEHCLGIAKGQSRRAQLGPETLFRAFRRPGDGAAGTNGIQSVLVAQPGGPQHRVRLLNAAQRTQGKERLIFKSLGLAAQGLKQALTSNGTRGAAVRLAETIGDKSFPTEGFHLGKRCVLKIIGR